MSPAFLCTCPGGIEIAVLAQPRASRTRLAGEHGGWLKVQLAAPPVDGEANAALIDLLADLFRVPRRQVLVASGEGSRRKRVRVLGPSLADAERVLTGSGPAT